MAIEAREIKSSSRAGMTHHLFILSGRAVGCNCESRQYRTMRDCRHMTAHNDRLAASDPFVAARRATRWNAELWRRETFCHGHWWAGDTCLYGGHAL
jgi:hypothetical protein